MGKKRTITELANENQIEQDVNNDNEMEMEIEAARQIMEEQAEKLYKEKQLHETSQNADANIYQHKRMEQKLMEMENRYLPWAETLQICEYELVEDRSLLTEMVHDDLAREMAFYNNTLLAVKFGRQKLHQEGIPYKRPEDFFCDMLKSDIHMGKIKDKLIFEQKKMEAFEQRKSSQEQRKYAKAVQANKLKEKSTERKDSMKAIADWRKGRKNQDGILNDDNDEELERIIENPGKKLDTGKRAFYGADKRGGSKNGNGRKSGNQMKNEKYGFGGKKKNVKRNDSKSTNDMTGFSPKGGKLSKSRGNNNSSAKGGKRMGKSKRMASKGGKR